MAKILVVNDDPVQLHLIATLLEEPAQEVLRAQSAEAALRQLAETDRIDALVLDLHMPGIDGWRLCRLLRSPEYQAFNALPILLMSATFSGADAAQITTDLGANGFLPLPVEPVRLRQCVRELLAGRHSRAVLRALIVEPHGTFGGVFVKCVGTHGWEGYLAKSQESARRILDDINPEVVVIDQHLPDGPGIEFLSTVKSPGCSTVAILMADDPHPRLALEAMRRGVDAFIRKPCDPEYLIVLCEKALRERALLRVEEILEERTVRLRESETRFRSLCEGLTDIVVVSDEQGIIRYINMAGARILDWSPNELIGQPSHLIGMNVPKERWAKGNEREAAPHREEAYVTRHGRKIDVEVLEQSIVFDGKRGTMVVARDIQVRKQAEREKARLERELQQAQKMEAIGRLAGGVAHDVNNILTAIMGHASLLSSYNGLKSVVGQPCQVIEEAARRGQQLTAQLLGMAKQGKRQDVIVDVNAIVQEVARLLHQQRGASVNVHLKPASESATVQGDPSQLHQVILNLMLNAYDAMPQGGTLTVQTKIETLDAAVCYDSPELRPGTYVVLTVSDTGCGIAPEIQDQIFEPFFTTKEPGKGSGMGLAMVYGIVKNHRGVLAVSSEVGQGTTMTVFLPYAGVATTAEPTDQQSAPIGGQGRILVIDDEELVARTAEELLRFLGYQVTVMTNPQEAVNFYQRAWREIDLIVLDVGMRAMSGSECFKKLRGIHPRAKVVLCTGYETVPAVHDLKQNGFAGFVQKPFDVKGLSQVVADVLGAGSSAVASPKASGRRQVPATTPTS